MKTLLFAAGVSITSLLATIGAANAEGDPLELKALPAQNFAFCLNTDADVYVNSNVASEVGVVITDVGNSLTNRSGTVVVAANNHYGNGAGGEWTSDMGRFLLSGGSCYNVTSMNKTTSPNPGTPWTCASTGGAASGAGVTITGLVATQTQVHPVATSYVVAGVSEGLDGAPVVHCPY